MQGDFLSRPSGYSAVGARVWLPQSKAQISGWGSEADAFRAPVLRPQAFVLN
jgi:hypothetical protein